MLRTTLSTGAWWFLGLACAVSTDPRFGHGHWKWYACGVIAIASLARIGWHAVDGWSRCRPVLRAVREVEARPMRYVRLHESDNRPIYRGRPTVTVMTFLPRVW
ncbi:hypothetical protein [Actinacidiphila oryziradicis]|uniref:Uncharacterized protein n=1 Tax=Actinacidiphila oryziradicis TaxID=2571141 RepID=A0A4U0SUP3_9ACTN|nr:hypothetical protein [Actinacidiphila oryziradicis]TKA11787.1 hypothetical protein FCI23_10725 [Actinacidiphila oryziradicis]